MAMFYSYVSLPEGKYRINLDARNLEDRPNADIIHGDFMWQNGQRIATV